MRFLRTNGEANKIIYKGEPTMNNQNEYALTANTAPQTPATVTVDGAEMLVDLTTAQTCYCSLTPETPEQQKGLYNAVNAPAHRLSEYIGKQITVSDVYVEVVTITNPDTGEVQKAPRIVLFNAKGESWTCVSAGVFGALKKLFAIFGTPDAWAKPLTLEVKQIERGNGRRLLSLVAV